MWYIALLLLLGLLFLVAELVLLPGVSVGALLTMICDGAAVYLAFDRFGTTTGIVVLLVCDIVSKQLTLPVNTITALLGIPIVIWVVVRNQTAA